MEEDLTGDLCTVTGKTDGDDGSSRSDVFQSLFITGSSSGLKLIGISVSVSICED